MSRLTRGPGLALKLALTAASLVVSLGLAELGFQVFARAVIFPRWDRDMAKPNFFLTRSADPTLAYEMAPGFQIEKDGSRLRINRWGLRSETDDRFEGRRKLAILGDSVTVGVGHSQERTLDRLLEQRLHAAGDDAVVINFGVPGYGTHELAEFLRAKNALYRVDRVIYLLNPNDFARRDSVYEGADNGLYRMFVRPTWQTPWFLRKAVYRVMKNGPVSVRWYRWLFAANEARAQADIRAMKAACGEQGSSLGVVLMPSGAAYGPDGYALGEMYEGLLAFLAREGIPALAPIEEFSTEPGRYFDETDHLFDVGNERMADVLHAFVHEVARS
jgi:lysophospholipase L1-like esterase